MKKLTIFFLLSICISCENSTQQELSQEEIKSLAYVFKQPSQLVFWEVADPQKLTEPLKELNNIHATIKGADLKDSITAFQLRIQQLELQIEALENKEKNRTADEVLSGQNDISDQLDTLKNLLSIEANSKQEEFYPLFNKLQLVGQYGGVLGYAKKEDTAAVNKMLHGEAAKTLMSDISFMWSAKGENNFFKLYALQKLLGPRPYVMDQSDIQQVYSTKNSFTKEPEIHIDNTEAGRLNWQQYTAENIGKSVAMTWANHVLSAPTINAEIPNGSSVISGGYSSTEAQALTALIQKSLKQHQH